MTDRSDAQAKAQRLIEAASWRIHLAEIDATTTPDFEQWLSEKGNADAWNRIESPWRFLDGQEAEPESVKARAAALQDVKKANDWRVIRRTWPKSVRAAAAVLFVGAVGLGSFWWLNLPDEYVTSIHERRTIDLADGSKVSLDAASDVTVRITHDVRELHLLKGQARFDVAHDVQRPFSVLAGDQKVVATGTAFNVQIVGESVRVTLIEGHVLVFDETKPTDSPVNKSIQFEKSNAASQQAMTIAPAPLELKAGEQLSIAPEKPVQIATVSVQRVIAWTDGQLMFDNQPLSDIVDEINRYTSKPVRIDDSKAAAMRISGVFKTGDVASFVDIVTRFLPLKAEATSEAVILTEKK